MTGEVHRVFRQTFLLCFAACALVACGPEVVRENRTEGLALEFRWISADLSRASYFEIACDGAFGSSGGVRARDFANWRSISYMFQEDRLLPWRTARANIEFGLEAGDMPRAGEP